VELVGQTLELAQPRVGDGEEPGQRPLAEPAEPRVGRQHVVDRSPVAAERDVLDPLTPRLEHPERCLGRDLDQDARLLLAPPPETVRGRAALLVLALDEARADLRVDQPLALENADRVAAEPDEQRGDQTILLERLEERTELDAVVLALVREPERGTHGNGLGGSLDPDDPVRIARPPRFSLERGEPFAHVLAADEPPCARR